MALILLLAIAMIGCQAVASPTPTAVRPTPQPTVGQKPGATTPPTPQQKGEVPLAKQYGAPPPMTIDQNKSYSATLHTTMGDMTVEFFPKDAPQTVNNFLFLAREGFYDNVKFHRIIRGFMVQSGDPTGTGAGGPGYRFPDETVTKDYKRGIMAMANAGRNTNGSQFFIMHADYALPKNYTIFGQVTDSASLEVLDKIATVPVRPGPTGEMSVPNQDIRITGVDVVEK
jgi:cyclophilin family peptidyl-prolyl cis-trans isomerase